MDKSVRTKHWFELDLNWIETDFKTGGCIINMLFRRHISGQSDANAPILSIVIGSYKNPTLEEIHSHKTTVKYKQSDNGCFCFISIPYMMFKSNRSKEGK